MEVSPNTHNTYTHNIYTQKHTKTHIQTHKHTMDARTQRRLKREKTREQLLKNETNVKQRKSLLKKARQERKERRVTFVQAWTAKREQKKEGEGLERKNASTPVNRVLVSKNQERMDKVKFTDVDEWHLRHASSSLPPNTHRWDRQRWLWISEKALKMDAFAKDLMKQNETLTESCEGYRRAIRSLRCEIVNLTKKNARANAQLNAWKKWSNTKK